MSLRRGLFRLWWVLSIPAVLAAEGGAWFLFEAPVETTGARYLDRSTAGVLSYVAVAFTLPPMVLALLLALLGITLAFLRWLWRGFAEVKR